MTPRTRKPPRRLRRREDQTKPTEETVRPPVRESKPFDAVEKKLSLTLDALLDAINTYRELSDERD